MRVLASLLLIAAACGPDEGALLGFEGTDVSADRVEIVLASAKPDHLTVLEDPRAGYFRQRINIDGIEDVGSLSALTVRIEADLLEAPEEAFIPFVFAFRDDTLVGVATFTDTTGKPTAIAIDPGAFQKYLLTVTPVSEVAAGEPLAPSTGTVVECMRNSTWRSGYAWQPAVGPQLRVLLPDPELDDDMKNATMRASDLDCDGHEAMTDDCDDLRAAVFPGAAETCDGVDSDCDGAAMEVVSCAGANTCASESVALCNEADPARTPVCLPDASCGCSAAAGVPCASCSFQYHAVGGEKATCAPAAGKLHTNCTGCSVEVVGVNGPFDVTVANVAGGTFGPNTMSLGYFFLRAELRSPTTFTADASESIGEAYLAVTTDMATTLMPVDLQISKEPAVDGACPPSTYGGPGDANLGCYP